jgi:hypothetical protein
MAKATDQTGDECLRPLHLRRCRREERCQPLSEMPVVRNARRVVRCYPWVEMNKTSSRLALVPNVKLASSGLRLLYRPPTRANRGNTRVLKFQCCIRNAGIASGRALPRVAQVGGRSAEPTISAQTRASFCTTCVYAF